MTHQHSVIPAVIGIMAKGNIDAAELLTTIHRVSPSDEAFVRWCTLAELSGVVGSRLVEVYESAGQSIGNLIIYVLTTQAAAHADSSLGPLIRLILPLAVSGVKARVS